MSEFPKNYATISLGEIASVSKERGDPTEAPDSPYVGLEHIEKDTAKLVGKGTAAEVKSTKSVFREGDLLYGKLRPYLNKVWLAEFEGLCSTDILVFSKSEALDNKFLRYRFLARDFVDYASANSSGVNLPRVSLKALGKFEIDLPPLPEQRRIVARIEELFSRLDAGVAALRQAKAQLQRYRQSVLAAAVTGQLTQAWREQHPETETAKELLKRILKQRREQWEGKGNCKEPEAPETAQMPQVPENWVWARLDSLCAIGSGMSVSKYRKLKAPVEVPYLRVANVQRGRLILDEIKTMMVEKERLDDMRLKKGDNLDIFWLKDDSLEDSDNLPPPAELAAEIVESLEVALEEFRGFEDALERKSI
ncbi:MAG: restriction endonuclease subunit S [Opitutales bacterium]